MRDDRRPTILIYIDLTYWYGLNILHKCTYIVNIVHRAYICRRSSSNHQRDTKCLYQRELWHKSTQTSPHRIYKYICCVVCLACTNISLDKSTTSYIYLFLVYRVYTILEPHHSRCYASQNAIVDTFATWTYMIKLFCLNNI